MSFTLNITKAAMLDSMNAIVLELDGNADIKASHDFIDQMQPDKHYAAVLGELKKKRSMDANAYAWVLLDKLSEKIELPAVSIYRDLVKDVGGVSEVLAIPDAGLDVFKSNWESHGIGWPCIVIGPAQYPAGYTLVQAFYGSSTYDTKQMARLIDLITDECKEQGIETMTPEDLSKLKGLTDDA